MDRLRFRIPPAGLLLAVLLVVPALAAPAWTQTSDHREITGDRVAVYNLAGEVRVVAGTGSSLTVDITRGGADAGKLRVETGRIGDRETLRIIYPDDEIVYERMNHGSRSEIQVRDDGTFGGASLLNGHRVRIHGGGSGLHAWADLTISVPSGINAAIYQAVGKLNASGVRADLRLDTAAAPVTAADIRGDLLIDVGSGSVEVRDIQGGLNIDTGSGSVEMTSVRGEHVKVDTGSGHVNGSNIEARHLLVDTGSGGIDLDAVNTKDATLDTGSGSVNLGLVSDVDRLKIDTGSGSVELNVPESLGADVRVDTGSGGIDIDVPHQAYRYRHSFFHGKLGDGQGTILIDTGSGSVSVLPVRT